MVLPFAINASYQVKNTQSVTHIARGDVQRIGTYFYDATGGVADTGSNEDTRKLNFTAVVLHDECLHLLAMAASAEKKKNTSQLLTFRVQYASKVVSVGNSRHVDSLIQLLCRLENKQSLLAFFRKAACAECTGPILSNDCNNGVNFYISQPAPIEEIMRIVTGQKPWGIKVCKRYHDHDNADTSIFLHSIGQAIGEFPFVTI